MILIVSVESTTLSLENIEERLGRISHPDGRSVGTAARFNPNRTYPSSIWVHKVLVEGRTHAGAQGISGALLSLGSDLATRISELVSTQCTATVSIVQEIDPEKGQHQLGLNLSSSSILWISRARANLDIDQYLLSGPDT